MSLVRALFEDPLLFRWVRLATLALWAIALGVGLRFEGARRVAAATAVCMAAVLGILGLVPLWALGAMVVGSGVALYRTGWAKGGGIALLGVATLVGVLAAPTRFVTWQCRGERAVPPGPGQATVGARARPAAPAIRLADQPFEVEGEVAIDVPSALRSWSSEELGSSVWDAEEEVRRWDLFVDELPGPDRRVSKVRLGVEAGQDVRGAVIVASEREIDAWVANARRVEFTAPEGSEAVEVQVGDALTEVGVFQEDRPQDGTVRHLRVELACEDCSLRSVELRSPRAEYDQPVKAGALDQGGVTMPGLYAHPGVRVSGTLPGEPSAKLEWWGAVVGGEATLRVGAGEAIVDELHLSPDEGWVPRRVDWPAQGAWWLEVEGDGVGLFGAPMLAVPDDGTPDVFVILLDTLRADRLATWARQPGPSPMPFLDRVAREGIAFRSAFSPSSWTKPAIPSLLTGLYPTTHRVGARAYHGRLPETVPMVQQTFAEAGWRTGSFTANPFGGRLSGLDRGFDHAARPSHWPVDPDVGFVTTPQLGESVHGWLRAGGQRPAFVYLQLMEAHEWWREMYQSAASEGGLAYDVAVRDLDRRVRELVDRLERPGRPAVFVFVSDHGESFGDHGQWKHGKGAFASQTHVPLILWGDGVPSATVDVPVSLLDVPVSLLDWFELPALEHAQGVSLWPLVRGGRTARARPVGSALLAYHGIDGDPDAPRQYSVVDTRGRHHVHIEGLGAWTFDWRADPCETWSGGSVAEVAAALERWRTRQAEDRRGFESRHATDARDEVDAGGVESLRALGYVE